MSLPIRATLEDISSICSYFVKKPTGATLADAATVLSKPTLDHRKIAAYKTLGVIAEHNDRYKLTERGKKISNGGSNEKEGYQEIIKNFKPYLSILERAYHRKEQSIGNLDVASHWHDHFNADVSDIDKTLKEQVMSFFYMAQGAGIGKAVLGRKGAQTRFDIDVEELNKFINSIEMQADDGSASEENDHPETENTDEAKKTFPGNKKEISLGQGIFIAHGKNKKPLEQLKKILDQFRIPSKIAVEEANLGRPISQKIRETMEACNCAILLFTCDEEFMDKEGKVIWRPSENVVYELGASSYLYGHRIVIMKEDGVEFPSNFRELCYMPFEKNQLEAKALDIFKELIGFGIVKVTT